MTDLRPSALDTDIHRQSDQFVADFCRLSPSAAIWLGRSQPGDTRLDDLSPDGLAEVNQLGMTAMQRMRAAQSTGSADDLARDVFLERAQVSSDEYDSGWQHAELNVMDSAVQMVRMVFDMMPAETDDDYAAIAGRMAAVPEALAGYRASLLYAADRGHVVAARQIDKCAQQCAAYAGSKQTPGYFLGLADAARREGALGAALDDGAKAASAAYAELGEFLTDTLRERAPEKDAVGQERYLLASRKFLGTTIDVADTYAWGWQEFLALEAEMKALAETIAPGAGLAGAAQALTADARYQVAGQDAFRAWMQDLSDAAVEALAGSHFDIPEQLRHLECKIAPAGQGVGAYYTGPSEDFSRPGRMWFSVPQDREVFSTWQDTTTVYHEGVPGHHLQIATATYRKDLLNDFQRTGAGTSGHTEGWALYAEWLMRELDYLDDPGNLLGMLDGQLFRAARVIVDLGMHLELEIPQGTGFHEGERWTPELGLEFLLTRTVTDPDHCRDEIDRYLGWPGQAPAYKIGERVWREGRRAAEQRHGSAFNVKDFHTRALNMGSMGLGPFERQLAQL